MKITRSWLVAAAAASMALTAGALGALRLDVQANDPQVAGDATSDTTAVFPTNKQNEPTIAVNPRDPRHLIAGANDEQEQPPCGPGPVRGTAAAPSDCSFVPGVGTSGVSTSADGGATWTNRGMLDAQAGWRRSPFVSDGDPVIVYGPRPGPGGFSWDNGARAYYASLASHKPGRSPYPLARSPELLVVSWSDDNGATWSAPSVATVKRNPNDFNDKESIWVDDLTTSPYFGRLYLSWTEFRSFTGTGNGSEPVMVATSTNGGSTWSAPKQLSPAGNNGTGNGRQGSVVRSGPDGTVYVGWEEGTNQVLSRSRDGGATWSRPVSMGPVVDIHDPIPGANFRTDSFPTIAADPRPGSRTVWASWVNRTAAGGRVVVTSSTDRGATWASLATVSTGGEGYSFFQGLDVAPNGRVDIGYQALRAGNPTTFGTGNATIDSWYVSLGGTGWSSPARVSSASSDPAASAQNNLGRQFFGDYNTLVSTSANAWFIFTDTRSGTGCSAVDEYQTAVFGTGVMRGDMGDRIASRTGQDPYSHEPGRKPAPPEHCPAQFGNSDARVAVIDPMP